MNLQDKVSSIRGVGEKKSKLLHNMKIDTVEDLLHLFPKKYEDRRNISYIMEAPFDKDVLIKGKVTVRQMRGNPYNKRTPLRILVQDESADLEVLFFNGRYLTNYFNIGSEYTFFGKIVLNNGRRQMAHPEFHKLGDKEDMRGIFPIYPLTEGLTQANMRKLQQEAASCIDQAVEWLPEDIVKRYNLCSPAYALKNVHFPDDERNIKEARYRMIFEELDSADRAFVYKKRKQTEKVRYGRRKRHICKRIYRQTAFSADIRPTESVGGDPVRYGLRQAHEPAGAGRRGFRQDCRGSACHV